MKYLHKYIKKYSRQFLSAILFLCIESLCDLMQPTIMSKIIDIGVKSNNLSYVLNMSVIMLLITGVGAVCATLRNIIGGKVSQRFGANLRLDLFKKVNSLSFEQLNNFDSASLITRLTNDVMQIQNFVTRLTRIFVKAPILCIGSVIIAFKLNSKLALIFTLVIPVIIILISLNMKISYPLYLKMQSSLDKINGIMREYLSGVSVVKAFNRFEYEEKRFENINEGFSKISKKALRVNSFFSPIIGLVVNVGIILVIWMGGIGVNNGTIEVGQIIAFINYMTKILFSLMMISSVFMTFIQAKACSERIGEVFSVKDFETEPSEQVIQKLNGKGVSGKICFEDVSFLYNNNNEENIIESVSFSCEEGETLGIVGSTGSGKSTLMNLLLGFYKVNSGVIKIDDIDINEMDEMILRNNIGIVTQKVVLFSGTIMENIKWGKEEASFEEIQEACKIAQIHDLINSLPEGYNTVLGQGGVNLSGGQKQRISIARALVRNPRILIMDDCTSALDGSTENKLKQAIKKFSHKLTCIIIAQRISIIKSCDKILVLENGMNVGFGTHEELKSNCAVYRDIIKSQLGSDIL